MTSTTKSIINIISGKRKTSVAKLKVIAGTGKIFYNHVQYTDLPLFQKLALAEPLRIYENELGDELKYDFTIRTSGGGKSAQIQAARIAIAKALVKLTGSDTLKKAYLTYDRNIIVQDARRKEASKPGDSAPRSKRQKSYR